MPELVGGSFVEYADVTYAMLHERVGDPGAERPGADDRDSTRRQGAAVLERVAQILLHRATRRVGDDPLLHELAQQVFDLRPLSVVEALDQVRVRDPLIPERVENTPKHAGEVAVTQQLRRAGAGAVLDERLVVAD